MYERLFLDFSKSEYTLEELEEHLWHNGYTYGFTREFLNGVARIVLYTFEDEVYEIITILNDRNIKYMRRRAVKNIPRQSRGKVEYI